MKILIMGSGGVGGYYGGRLAQAGRDVTFVARGGHLKALQSQGLRIISPEGDIHLPHIQAVSRPEEAGKVDLVLVSVKTYDLEEAAHSLLPVIGPDTTVIPFLNGVDAAERLGAVLGLKRMMGGVVRISAFIDEPGVIKHVGMNAPTAGELAGGTSTRGDAVIEALTVPGFPIQYNPDIFTEIWLKFLMLHAIAGAACLTRQTWGPISSDPDSMAIVDGLMEEGFALAQKLGANIAKENLAQIRKSLQGFPSDAKPSMLLDLERGKKLEVESLNGKAVALGKALNIPVPFNKAVYGALKPYMNGHPAK